MIDADLNLLKGSMLYREFHAERHAILENKWYLSEKAKHDVGFEKALLDWIINHRARWRRERNAKLLVQRP